jgi:hypothetical protein
MGKRSKAAKASLAAAFIAAGGTAATSAQSAANPADASVEGVLSSWLGPLGLRDDFQKQWKVFELTFKFDDNFNNFYKLNKFQASDFVVTFASQNKLLDTVPSVFQLNRDATDDTGVTG